MRVYTGNVTETKRLRVEAGLTQTEVCARTGIARPNLSAYEFGRRTPSPETVERIRAACRRRPSEIVAANADEIRAIVLRHHGVSVEVFGSAARGDDRWDSDIDLLITLDDEAGILDLVRMQRDLERMLGTEVDLVDRDALDAEHSQRDRMVLADAVGL